MAINMYAVLGWINVGLISLMLLPFAMFNMNSWFFKKKDAVYLKLTKFLRKLHRYLGIPLVISIIYHGFLALGSFRLHTGTILGVMAGTVAIFGLAFILLKKKWAFKAHKVLAIVFVLLLILHLVFPSALYYIFRV